MSDPIPVPASNLSLLLAGGGEQIRAKRASAASSAIRIHQDGLINRIEVELARLRSERDATLDLSPDDSTSLRAVGRDFDPAAFVAKVQELDCAIATQVFYLNIARTNHKEWFPTT